MRIFRLQISSFSSNVPHISGGLVVFCSAEGLLSQNVCLAQMKSAGNPVVLANNGKEVLAFRGKQRYLTRDISVTHTHSCYSRYLRLWHIALGTFTFRSLSPSLSFWLSLSLSHRHAHESGSLLCRAVSICKLVAMWKERASLLLCHYEAEHAGMLRA